MKNSGDNISLDNLTSHQKKAFKSFEQWLEASPTSVPYILSGFAGSGKTYLSMRLLKLVDDRKLCWTVAAPTHKAVGVLREIMDLTKLKPTWYPSTIHRLLRLKLKRKGSIEICERTEQTSSSLEQLGLVLIDEASMIDSILLEIIFQCSYQSATRVVYIGDPAQLPPVGEEVSPVFSIKNAIISELKDVVRHQGPVLNLSTCIRDGIISCKQPSCFPVIKTKKSLVGTLAKHSWLDKAKAALKSASVNDNPDKARILCYTNRFLEHLVPHARRAIHGEMADQFAVLPGEVLMSQRAIMASASIENEGNPVEPGVILGSNREMIVVDIKKDEIKLGDLGVTQQINTTVTTLETLIAKVKSNHLEFSLRLMPQVGSTSRRNLEAILKKISQKAKEAVKSESTILWKLFFHVRDSFATVAPACVLTVHRSQGSTFEEVYIASDVFWPKDITFRRQLVYVAVSRASKEVWLLGNDENILNEDKWSENLLDKI